MDSFIYPNKNPLWTLLIENIENLYPENSKIILKDLDVFLKIISTYINDAPFISQKIAYDILGYLYNNKEYNFEKINWKDIKDFYENSSLKVINIDYKFPNLNTCFKIPKISVFEPSNHSFLNWFLMNFSNDILIASEIFKSLCLNHDDIAFQDILFSLLGEEKIEIIIQLITNKKEILTELMELYECRKAFLDENIVKNTSGIHSQIHLSNTLAQKETKKAEKIRKKRIEKYKKEFSHLDWKFLEQFFIESDIIKTSQESQYFLQGCIQSTPQYPYVFDAESTAKTSFNIAGKQLKLPVSAIHYKQPTYEEIIIPPPKSQLEISWPIIHLKDVEEITQKVFPNITSFNSIQSLIYDTALNSSENLLVCAPTGAGKTNIALLTILRELRNHFVEQSINKSDIKVVYIAPMKALASEITKKLSSALSFFDLKVKEVTGDIQPPRKELMSLNVIVTTPEKWDVLTRKSDAETSHTLLTCLLIIDEIHLLQDDRGSVIEALVSRSLRFVESCQIRLRIIGLSATLPNFLDVSDFLRVNPKTGLFVFDGRFRPVSLEQRVIGIKTVTSPYETYRQMDTICFEKTFELLVEGHQVIIFVHSRESTRKTALSLREFAQNRGLSEFLGKITKNSVTKNNFNVKAKVLKDLLQSNLAIHHAGLSRHDRNCVESLFLHNNIKVLVSTSTLAWGVNLPAHAVIIKGTSLYDAASGKFKDIGVLDIQQMFGRAGRPQFDTFGIGILITEQRLFANYVGMFVNSIPIESKFHEDLIDSLNAEIVLGSVTTVEEAVSWLSYSFFYIRVRKNPLVYGVSWKELQEDPTLKKHRHKLIFISSEILDKSRMVRFNPESGILAPTSIGRIGSHFYIKCKSINLYYQRLHDQISDFEALNLLSLSSEFEQLKLRNEENQELLEIVEKIPFKFQGCQLTTASKVVILIQAFLSRIYIETPSLASDLTYITQNIGRLSRGIYEICIASSLPSAAYRFLSLSKCFEFQIWPHEHPLMQLRNCFKVNQIIFDKLSRISFSLDRLKEMDANEIGYVLNHISAGNIIHDMLKIFPCLELQVTPKPLTRTVIQFTVIFKPKFKWHTPLMTQGSDIWAYWVEDPISHTIFHYNRISITPKKMSSKEPIIETFTIPAYEPLPAQYYVRAISFHFLGSEAHALIDSQDLVLPEHRTVFTRLLALQPLPVSALLNSEFEKIYNFKYFNPIQTQTFHTLFYTDSNVLLGAPTGSGKTVVAEIAILRAFKEFPDSKVVYVAPMKALVRERFNDWSVKFSSLNKIIIQMTGDETPDAIEILKSDIILTTPEKWDGLSRRWKDRQYVRKALLLILDEVHLLGADRGHTLEAIVARVNIMGNETGIKPRIVALSTATANPLDLAVWLNVPQQGLFNFDPSVRPVPLIAHIHGFPAKNYCPRMESMNRTVYQAIRNYSSGKPVLIFVSSRRQTRLTASALLALSSTDQTHLGCFGFDHSSKTMSSFNDDLSKMFSDENLKCFVTFGIGIHHAGLPENDRKNVEKLFLENKIQVLVATATLAWGVNFPAHLVIVKGTEFFDSKTHSYVDFPITDILQMMGRAGRPQFDNSGVGVILVYEPKKDFYKKFLYDPFPVESCLLPVLPDHLNAEISSGSIKNIDDAYNFIKLTFWFRRLKQNPTFYGAKSKPSEIDNFSQLEVQKSLFALQETKCIEFDDNGLSSTLLGSLASHYYLSHKTIKHFHENLIHDCSMYDLLWILACTTEFDKVPVRHNEDNYNETMSEQLPLQPKKNDYSCPHVKTFLLLQAQISRSELPIKDYYTDKNSVLDQSIRIIQAMIDYSAISSHLTLTLQCILLLQSIIQGCWWHKTSLLSIPFYSNYVAEILQKGFDSNPINCVAQLLTLTKDQVLCLTDILRTIIGQKALKIQFFIENLPKINISWTLMGDNDIPIGHSNPNYLKRLDLIYIDCPIHQELKLIINIHVKFLKQPLTSKVVYTSLNKEVEDGWIFVIGERERDELISMKRISSIRSNTRASLSLGKWQDDDVGSRRILTLYIMSECYFGLDQQVDIPLEIVSPTS